MRLVTIVCAIELFAALVRCDTLCLLMFKKIILSSWAYNELIGYS